jgi:acyl dehydratase
MPEPVRDAFGGEASAGSQSDAFVQPKPLGFGDLVTGAEYWSRPYTFQLDDVVAFAEVWDPQTYHTDERAAETSIFGRLSASGMHSLLVSHRIFNDLWLFRRIGLAGTGMENFRWRRPVYPGDTVRVRGRVAGIEPKSGERAVLTMEIEMLNQDDVIVLRYDLNILVRTDR